MLGENAIKVLERRYLKKDANGNVIETPEELFKRVAKHIAQGDFNYTSDLKKVEKTEKEFFNMMWDLDFLPNSPTLMNAGKELGQLSACFVLPIENDVKQILQTVKNTALIHKSGGGTGFNFSKVSLPPALNDYDPIFVISDDHPDVGLVKELKLKNVEVKIKRRDDILALRSINRAYVIEDNMESIFDLDILLRQPEIIDFSLLRQQGQTVKSTHGVASGPASFMKVWDTAVGFLNNEITPITGIKLFDASTEAVKQGGTRRGANMGIVNVNNRYVKEFVTCKQNNDDINNFNISVGIVEGFMEALEYNEMYPLKDYATGEYVDMIVDVNKFFDGIVKNAWNNGEPGIIFLDRVNQYNPILTETVESTNPCVVGDTLVQTVEGEIEIKDLVGKEIDVYCMDYEGRLTISRAKNIRMTRKNAELVNILTSRGNLICTPDHKIYTRNRGYVEAKDITYRDKIVGLNRKMQGEKYTAVALTGDKNYVKEHRFIAGHYYNTEGKDVHHKDENTLNNVKSNLEVLSHGGHSVISNIGHTDWSERDSEGKFIKKDKKKKKEQLSIGGKVGVNLRVIGVVKQNYQEDVYDLEVETYHNFLANGIVIHNCGEQPLFGYESCNLGSLNLGNFVIKVDGIPTIDYDRLGKVIRKAVHFLDNVIEMNKYPIPEIDAKTRKYRKIGLGVMGWSDILYRLGIPYNSNEAVELARTVSKFLNDQSKAASKKLAKERGSFPAIADSIYKTPMRNATTTTIAPTGTLSIIADCSGGIEPLFGLAYIRNVMDNTELLVVNPIFEEVYKTYERTSPNAVPYDKFMSALAKKGSLHAISDEITVPTWMEHIYVTAHDISPEWHIKMQAAWQEYVDNAVSKTINLTNDAPTSAVKEAYMLAYQTNCKGVTIYRDGSRDLQVLNIGHVKGKEKLEEKKEEVVTVPVEKPVSIPVPAEPAPIAPRERPDVTNGFTEKVKIGCGTLYITVNYDSVGLCEVFINNGKAGGCPSQSEATARMASLMLRTGMDPTLVIQQLKGIRCQSTTGKKLKVLSCPDAIGRVIEKAHKQLTAMKTIIVDEVGFEEEVEEATSCGSACSSCSMKSFCNNPDKKEEPEKLVEVENKVDTSKKGVCTECGMPMEHEGGCTICMHCGHSKCG